MQLPWRREIVEGLLGADLVGFQVPGRGANFMQLARRLVDATPARARTPYDGRVVRVGAFPISIDAARVDASARRTRRSSSARAEIRARPRRTRGRPARRRPARLHQGHRRSGSAPSRELLAEGVLVTPRHVMVQIAVPSREDDAHYRTSASTSSGSSARSTASTARRASRDPVPAPERAARRAGRALPGGRRDAGDAAARRHEPRRQGVRRVARRRDRRAGAVRVRGRGPRAARRDAGEPARPRRHQGGDPRTSSTSIPASRRHACAACAGSCAATTCTRGRTTSSRRCSSPTPRRSDLVERRGLRF